MSRSETGSLSNDDHAIGDTTKVNSPNRSKWTLFAGIILFSVLAISLWFNVFASDPEISVQRCNDGTTLFRVESPGSNWGNVYYSADAPELEGATQISVVFEEGVFTTSDGLRVEPTYGPADYMDCAFSQ